MGVQGPKSRAGTNEADLVHRLLQGEAQAWGSFMSALRARVRRLRLSPRLDREELLSDTATEVWRALPRLRDGRMLYVYATRIARRLACRKLREGIVARSVGRGPDVALDDASTRNVESEELLSSLLLRLKSADRTLFGLLFVAGADGDQIQAELGLSEVRLRKRKHLLLKKLRRTLCAIGWGEPVPSS